MKNSDKYYANTVYSFRNAPVQENTVIFIESYDEDAHGNCKAVLKQMVLDERFKQWRFMWTLPESVEYDPERITDERIEIVSYGSYGFLKTCELAQFVVTAAYLPNYYIKKEGQTVIGCFPASVFQQNCDIQKDRVRLQMTLDKLDLLYIENKQIFKGLQERYSGNFPFELLEGFPLRTALPDIQNAEICVALTESVLGSNFFDLEEKYKQCQFLCVEHEKSLCFQIDRAQYRTFLIENEPEILSHLISDELAFCEIAKGAELIITDRLLNAIDAIHLGIPCILISETRVLMEYFPYDNSELLKIVSNWNEATDALQKNIENVKRRRSRIDSHESIMQIMNIFSGKRRVEKNFGTSVANKELWVVPNNIPDGFWQVMRYYRPSQDISILVRGTGKGKLWKNGQTIPNRKRLYCKIGACAEDEKNGRTDELLCAEWKRLLGEQRFAKAYVWDKANELWKDLYKKLPAETVIEAEQKLMADVLFCGLAETSGKTITKVNINEKEYYELGRVNNQKYYLQAKAKLDRVNVVFLSEESEISQYEKLVDKSRSTDISYVFIDPFKYMVASELLNRKNIYWIPKNILPIRLLVQTKNVYGYGEHVAFSEDLIVVK